MVRNLTAAALLALLLAPAAAQAASPDIVISEFRARGPAGGNDEFVELRNTAGAAVSIAGYRLAGCAQGDGAVTNRATVPAGVTLAPGQAYLFTNNGANGYSGSEPGDQTYNTGFTDFSGTNQAGIRLLDAGGATKDGVGAPNSPCREGTGFTTPTGNGDNSFARTQDTDDNAADFEGPQAGTPENSGDKAPAVDSSDPPDGGVVTPGATLSVTFTEPVEAGSGAFSLTCGESVGLDVASDDETTFTLDPQADLPRGEDCTLAVDGDAIRDADADDPPDTGADATITFTVAELTGLRIHDVQGASHRSPYDGRTVEDLPGVVTAVSNNGFWMQDPQPDASEATSEGIFVFRGGRPAVGSAVTVTGRVSEFRPGAEEDGNLSTTEITFPTVTVTGTGPEIAPTLLGPDGRRPPQRVIEDDAFGDVEFGDVLFDPREDGLDFHESLEGMYVEIQRPQAVGPTNNFGEIPVVADGAASVRSARGGVVVRPEDFNPERFILDDVIDSAEPDLNVGDGFTGPLRAVVDYSFGNFKYLVTDWPGPDPRGLQPEVTQAPTGRQVAIASMNVENLAASNAQAKFDRLAAILVNNLRAPDIVAVEEVQDNDGAASEGDSDASETWERFIQAIVDSGGPRYEYRQIDPTPGADGGEPGGNIRVGFLFRPDRQVQFVDRPGGDATTPTREDTSRRGAQLTLSPGRLDPENPAFTDSRKPLAGEFKVRGRQLFVIANHFNSKGGDEPLFGRIQPPERSSEVQRHAQARVVRDFVRSLLKADLTAPIVVLGDFNDFEFSETLRILESGGVGNLMRLLPQSQRYSYVFDGNSQVLDQILVSLGTLGWIPEYDSVHVNAEFADQASDHDPQVARLTLP